MSQNNNQPIAIDRLGFLLHDASRLLRKRFEQNASRYGLSSAQWRLLVRVFKEEGIPQARLAELLEVEPISVSRLVDRMEEGGWIERRADAADRRVRNIFLSDKSRAIFGEMRAVAESVFEDALAGLDGAERQTVLGGLQTICSNLSDVDPKAAAESQPHEAA
jgi:MarR family transcriptional regulator for hemolysin